MCRYIAPHLNKKNEVVSISGPSASGKTTLALQLVSELMNPEEEEKAIWVQASEHFPKKRMEALLSEDIVQKAYVLKHTYIFPPTHVIQSFEELVEILERLSKQDLPHGIKLMVIDNISHHLRYHLSHYGEICEKSKVVNMFFDSVLFPLIMRCLREGHRLLVHFKIADIKQINFNVFVDLIEDFFS